QGGRRELRRGIRHARNLARSLVCSKGPVSTNLLDHLATPATESPVVVEAPRKMRVVFLAPIYPPEMIEYTRGLAEVGAKVFGVGDTPREALPSRVRPYLHDYL